jgi:hypothetical protein
MKAVVKMSSRDLQGGWCILAEYKDGSQAYLCRDINGTGYIYDDINEARRAARKRKNLASEDRIFIVPASLLVHESMAEEVKL